MTSNKAILTGELVHAGIESAENSRYMLGNLEIGLRLIHAYTPITYEIIRSGRFGNNFHIETDNVNRALDIALLLRLFLKSKHEKGAWDARLGVGIGENATALSHAAFESLQGDRLALQYADKQRTAYLALTTKFVDAFITPLTQTQAKVLSYYLRYRPITHAALAQKLQTSRVNTTQILNTAHYKLIELYLQSTQSAAK